MTDYSNLLDEGRIKRGRFSSKQVRDCLKIADRDMKAAKANLDTHPEWAYMMAYNAMQQAGRAYLFREGYRAVGEGHHATVVRFLRLALGSDHSATLAVMDRMRRRRNRATYDTAGLISKKAASEAVSTAGDFLDTVRRLLAE